MCAATAHALVADCELQPPNSTQHGRGARFPPCQTTHHASHDFVHFAISPIGPETAVMSSLSSLAPSRSRRAVLLQSSAAKSIPDAMNYTPHMRRARGCRFTKSGGGGERDYPAVIPPPPAAPQSRFSHTRGDTKRVPCSRIEAASLGEGSFHNF